MTKILSSSDHTLLPRIAVRYSWLFVEIVVIKWTTFW